MILTIIGALSAAIILLIGIYLGIIYGHTLQRKEEKEQPIRRPAIFPSPKVSLSQEQKKERTKKLKQTSELGAVNRPTVEELEKRDKPQIQEEEEAWDETMQTIAKTQNRNNGEGGIWTS